MADKDLIVNLEDLKVVGDAVGSLKSAVKTFTGNEVIPVTQAGKYINTSGTTADITEFITDATFNCFVIPCSAGDKFTVDATGGNSPRAFAFIEDDEDGTILQKAGAGERTNGVIVAPENSAYLVINDKTGKTQYYGEYLKDRVSAVEDILPALPFISNTTLNYQRIQACVLGTVNESFINFLSYPNGRSFVCKVLPNAQYYVKNPGGDRFRIVTTSYNPMDYVGGNQQLVDGNYYYGDEANELTVTTKSTDNYMTVFFTITQESIYSLTAIYGNKENGNKLLLNDLVVHENDLGYSVDDNGSYYSSETDYMGSYIGTTTDISLLYDIYDGLVTTYPTQVTKETFCTDTDDNVTYMYKFVPPNVYNRSHERKTVFIICGTHGFETPQMFHCANMFKEMLENWKTEPAFEALIMNYDFAVIPCLNVYGFTHDTRKNERGVDLNRNYVTGWADATGTEYTDPDSQYYKGTAPFSEVQTQAVRDFVLKNADKIAFCMDFHFAGSQTYINSTMDYIKAFYGWESYLNAWLMKHPDFAQMDESTNKAYLMDNMILGSAALWLNTVRPSVLLETAGTVGISGDSNAKTTQNYSETAFINALLFGLRWLRK